MAKIEAAYDALEDYRALHSDLTAVRDAATKALNKALADLAAIPEHEGEREAEGFPENAIQDARDNFSDLIGDALAPITARIEALQGWIGARERADA